MKEQWTEESVIRMLVNPHYAISVAPQHTLEPPVDRSLFIRTQKRLLQDIGEDKYFSTLLDVLERGV